MPAGNSDPLVVDDTADRLTVTLNRPARRNALDHPLLDQLAAVLRGKLERGGGLVLLRASGPVFCAGADLSPVKAIVDPVERKKVFAPHAGRIAEGIGIVVELLLDPRLITVAAIPGPAIGGGWILPMGCDFRIASTAARFWFPEIELGRVAGSASVALMTELAGPLAAREMFMCARRFAAAELLSMRLLSAIAPPEQLDETVDAFCQRLESLDAAMLVQLKRRILDGSTWRRSSVSWRE